MSSCYSQSREPVDFIEFFGSSQVGFLMSQLRRYALAITESEDGANHVEHLSIRFGEDDFVTIEGLRLKLLLMLLRNRSLLYVAPSMPEDQAEQEAPWVTRITFEPLPPDPNPVGIRRPIRRSLFEDGEGNNMPLPG